MNGENCFVIGNGFVGQATRKSLDIPYYFDLKGSNITLEEGAKKLFCFICLPTPTDGRGQQKGIDLIRDYIKQIKGLGGRNIFVIRSTVLPGTCRGLAKELGVMVVSNPEMLSEKTWEHDALFPRVSIIGADNEPEKIALTNLWKSRKAKFDVITDTVTAETLKYTFNLFNTLKVVFSNQIYDNCQITGADYKVIEDALHQHPWGSKHHFKVIHKGGRGAGGHCFPKDLSAFASFSNLELFKTVKKINQEYLDNSHKD
jgi:nucleotide sugar dehydrogenase